MVTKAQESIGEDTYKFGWNDPDFKAINEPKKGLSEAVVEGISELKGEPQWMRDFRLKAYRHWQERPMPTGFWGCSIQNYSLDFNDIYYYGKPVQEPGKTWDEIPAEIKRTFEKLGIPEAERKFLSGVEAQYDSEVVYHNIREDLKKQGVIFVDTDTALREHEDLMRQYFGKIIPANDNKFASLNSAVWSGGSFIYVPPGVKVEMPLQAYFRINTENMGQFERTLIIADEGSEIHYVEGCTAPTYSSDSLHSAVVEIIVKKGAKVRYTTIQNWSDNVFNLVTKRMAVYGEAVGEWIDGNLGSKLTMKYPSTYLLEPGAHGEILSLAMAGPGQHQDAGGKCIHVAPYTTSVINSQSISKGGGRTSHPGQLKVYPGARRAKATARCDARPLDDESRCPTWPREQRGPRVGAGGGPGPDPAAGASAARARARNPPGPR